MDIILIVATQSIFIIDSEDIISHMISVDS